VGRRNIAEASINDFPLCQLGLCPSGQTWIVSELVQTVWPSAIIDHLESGEVTQSVGPDRESSKSRLAPIVESQQENITGLHRTRNTTGRPNLDGSLLRPKQSAAQFSEHGPALVGGPGFVPHVQVAAGINYGDRAIANRRIEAPNLHLGCRESGPETGAIVWIVYILCEAA